MLLILGIFNYVKTNTMKKLLLLLLIVPLVSFGQTAEGFFNSGKVKDSLEDDLGAIEDFTKAIDLDPNNANIFYRRGLSKFYLEDYPGSITDFNKAIDINPDYDYAYYSRGKSKHNLEDYEGAVTDFSKSIQFDPNYAETYELRGFSKKKLGDYKGSLVDYSKARELRYKEQTNEGFNIAIDYNLTGILKDSLNDNLGAISDYSKAIAIWRNPEFIKNRLLSMRSSSDEYKLFMNAGIDSFYGEINLVCENETVLDDQENINNDGEVKEEDNSEVPFAVIEDVPRFMLCYLEKNSDARECFQEQMNAHIRRNFRYPEIAQEKNIQGRVYINFIISECGYIENIRVRGPDENLEKEAIRIISLLPRMIPGKQDGKAVRVPFSIPITFRLQ